MGKIKWRKWNNILHRDIGYLAVGLTIIFAVSGIAVNHVADWNPSYKIENADFQIGPLRAETETDMVKEALRKLNISAQVQNSFRPSPDELNIYLQNHTIFLNIKSGQGRHEIVNERFLLRDFNFLHLNHAKNIWTWISDIYAAALLFLAISGLFVLKGRKGLTGRGKWLTVFGFIIPLLFLILYK
jgi:hypothetical protein